MISPDPVPAPAAPAAVDTKARSDIAVLQEGLKNLAERLDILAKAVQQSSVRIVMAVVAAIMVEVALRLMGK